MLRYTYPVKLHHNGRNGNGGGQDHGPKRLIVSACRHGVTDSFSTKGHLERLERSKDFEIIGRGVDPIGKPQDTPEGMRGLELQIDDIKRAVLILIHKSNEYLLHQRFGRGLTSALETAGYLYVRTGRETQFLEKDTDRPSIHIAEWSRIYRDLLDASLRRVPAESIIAAQAFVSGQAADERWQKQKQARTDRKNLRRRK